MWFWLFVIILGIGIGGTILGYWMYDNTRYDTDWLKFAGTLITALSAIVVLIMGICIIFSHTTVEANIEVNTQRYERLTYQLKNDLYDNDTDLGKKELYNQIQEWNEDLAYYQNVQDDLWLGIFHPNIYDQFEFINY